MTPETFVAAVMKGLEADTFEIGHGMAEGMLIASRSELDRARNVDPVVRP